MFSSDKGHSTFTIYDYEASEGTITLFIYFMFQTLNSEKKE